MTADTLILPIAGFLIVTLLSLLAWFGRKWISSLEMSINKIDSGFDSIIDKLDMIRGEIDSLKTENKLTSNYIHEIEGRIELRFSNVQQMISENHNRIVTLENRVTICEKVIDKMKTLHERNHKKTI